MNLRPLRPEREGTSKQTLDNAGLTSNDTSACTSACTNSSETGRESSPKAAMQNGGESAKRELLELAEHLAGLTPKQRQVLSFLADEGQKQGGNNVEELSLDLVQIVAAWPGLPEHIKAAIEALVQTHTRGGQR